MDEIDQSRIGSFDSAASDFSEPPRRVSRLLLLWPLAGVIALLAVMVTYQPLDDTLIYWIGAAPCMIPAVLINVAWRKQQGGGDLRSFLPGAVWIAIGCLFLPMVLLTNGALDRSPVESHHQVVTRTILTHGRRGSVGYYLELTSWRANRTHEKLMVYERWYLVAKPGDPVTVETHRGAFGIPLLVSVHKPD
jgi:hypothetical protein